MIRSCRAQVLGDVEATKQKSDDENKQKTIKNWDNVCITIDWLTHKFCLNINIVTALLFLEFTIFSILYHLQQVYFCKNKYNDILNFQN